ncbi:MAG: serine/threonine protein kinase, partial [Deltaproteobacteria bacterium]|nr:serine/threonine protein kinase [Deltaproteobacteria bacterium]
MTRNLPLPELLVGPALCRAGVGMFPVYARAPLPRADYVLAATVMARGELEIHEASLGATVGLLEARNRSAARALIVEGDHVVGARQNRMLTSSVLVGAHRTVAVPASCVEQGRWRGPTERFAGMATMAPANLRRVAKVSVTHAVLGGGGREADQGWIWATIAAQQHRLGVASATQALAQTYAAREGDLAPDRDALAYPAGAIGVAIAVGDELVSVDVFDRPQTCAQLWPRLADGALLDGLGRVRRGTESTRVPYVPPMRVAGADVHALVQAVRACAWTQVHAVGDGDERRAELAHERAAASLLCLDGRLVHLGVATQGAEPAPSHHAPRVHSRLMRRELPPALARYRIVDRIGVGGTKEVFRATDTEGGPDVAIARMPYVDTHTFEHEIAVIRGVRSEHVPQIHATHVDAYGDGYIVMERCDGPNLAAVAGGRPLSLAEAAPLLVAFARGLRAIHEAHVLHRDIKLENVMLSRASGRLELKIVDFGVSARASAMSTAVSVLPLAGTYPYMARETLHGAPLDARTDVYAFGVCCYRLLTGEFPVAPEAGESEFAYLMRLRATERHDLSRLPPLPAGVRRLLERMLDVDAEQRPYMPEVVAELERELGTPPLALPLRLVAGAAG